MKTVISCSRRTDIPGCHYSWLQDRLADGFVEVENPYTGIARVVSLDPGSVHSVCLWSKNFEHLLREPGRLSDYNLYMGFTITGLGPLIEPRVPSWQHCLGQMEQIVSRYGKDQVVWRFDPLIWWSADGLPSASERLRMFETLAREMSQMGVLRCISSFAQIYPSVRQRLARLGTGAPEATDEQKAEFAREMAVVAQSYGIMLESCCDSVLLSQPGVKKSSCVSGVLLNDLFGAGASRARDRSQREACGCTISNSSLTVNRLK